VFGRQGSPKGVIVNDTDRGWDPPPNGWSESGPFFILTDYSDSGLRIMDANGDGMPDLVQSGKDGATPLTGTYINTGSAFSDGLGSSYNIDPLFYDNVFFGDVNGDGLTDFIQGDASAGRSVYTNRADGTGWWEDSDYVVPLDFSALGTRVADVNNDGLVDIIVSISTSTSFKKVYINKGDGTGWEEDSNYSIPVHFEVDGEDQGVRIADVTNDGYPDIIISKPGNQSVYVNKGDGTGWSSYGTVSIPGNFVDSGGHENGFRFADVTGDGILDLVKAVCDDEDVKGVYLNDGDFSDTINYPDSLTNITTATGEGVEVKYLTSPLYKDGSGNLLNPELPLVLNTVRHIIRDDGSGNLATTTYEYGGGEYFFEDSLHRRFAGFATTTVTDPDANYTKTYFHQGNSSETSIGEHNDGFSKIGKPYRVEVYDSNDNLYRKAINKWESVPQSNDRNYVQLTQTVTSAFDGDADHRDQATRYTYDEYSGNLLLRTEYGEVTGSDDGTFTDTGTDTRFASTTYAASTTPHLIGLPARERIFDYASSTIRDTQHYYDGLSLYAVDVGNETKTELWKSGSDYASTTRAYNAYGLVTSETDGESHTTTYTYDSFNLYPATSTNALSQDTGYQYDYTLGRPKVIVDGNNNAFERVHDGLDRPITEKQPDLTTPSTLVTRKTYGYTDTQGSRKVVETNHLDGSTDFTLHTYLDGMDRTVQTRKEAEGTSSFSVRDFTYNGLGLLEKESLPYFSTGSSKTSPTVTAALYTTYAYDPLQRISSVANAVGTTTNAYDQWATTITDPNDNDKRLTNDAFGRLANVVEFDGTAYATTTYEWYADDTLATTTTTMAMCATSPTTAAACA
jgi:Insecticide toxin TcdB middle/N-terminal region/FG-GAP-like repeat